MIGHGNCPKCEKPIEHANIDKISVGDKTSGPLYRGVTFICPYCRTILGVAFDPIAQKADIASAVLEALGHKARK